MDLFTVRWEGGKVVMIDQTRLPRELVFVEYTDYRQVARAIRELVVRGAPAIGVSGAFGMALAALSSKASSREQMLQDLEEAKAELASTRPTAVNLAWGLERVMRAAFAQRSAGEIREAVVAEARAMADEDVRINRAMGAHGAQLFGDGSTIMTHCNAGSLATVAYGTALGVIRATREGGKSVKVVATETRPVQQGSRLTAFELQHDGFDVTLIPDTAVGYAMSKGMVDGVIVGADRVLRDGHVFNKIGTYQVAVMAGRHGVPFYVAAPSSTFDMESLPGQVKIEMRGGAELTGTGGARTAPEGVGVMNPAFDMTPPELVSGIVTELGVAAPPFSESIPKLLGQAKTS